MICIQQGSGRHLAQAICHIFLSYKEQTVDALGGRGEEGRTRLR